MLLALLIKDMAREVDFSFTCIAMDPGYPPEHRSHIADQASRLGLSLHFFETNVLRVADRHSPEHPCFLCSKMRRGYLYAEAQKLGCTKIALGHHFDDAIESVLMGLLYGGQIQAMLPRLPGKNYPGMELIRPLYFVREQAVSDWAEACGLHFEPCCCPVAQKGMDTKRAEIKRLIASLSADNPQIEKNILNAVKSVDTKKLLGWRDAAGEHSFLDIFEDKDR